MNDVAGELVPFNIVLVPAHKPEGLHANMRSSAARNLPSVIECHAHDMELSIVGGGPSLEDTYKDLTGYIAAVNGSLGWLLDRGVVPHMCGVCDPSPHMVDIVTADPRVTYFLASIVHPSAYDKLLNAGCKVYRWNISSVPGGDEVRDSLESASLTVGGGSTMGLRWITLGYVMGFRTFHLHGMDSSFRGKASHAYPDHQDAKDWIGFEGFQTRPNFIGQVVDFLGWLERLKDEDAEPVRIAVYGDGLLQTKFRAWKEHNAGWHEGRTKPEHVSLTGAFEWHPTDRMAKATALAEVRYMDKFLAHVPRRGVAVQAGGNVGVYPAHLAKHFREVHTFEPEPVNCALLFKNIQTVKGQIRAYHTALGERDGTCDVMMPDPTNSGAVLVKGDGDIPMRMIDTLDLPACDLIWLDIEGYEFHALRGAEKTIEKFWPAVIVEDNPTSEKHGIPRGAAVEWLHQHGYVFAIKYGADKLYLPTAVPLTGVTKESEKAKYERAWGEFPVYRLHSPGEALVDEAIERLGMKPPGSVIDFGCGPGRATKRFDDHGFQAVGVDIASNCFDQNIAEQGIAFVEACLWELPPNLLQQDWGFCCDVMEHIPPEHVEEVLAGIRRTTRKGAFFQIAFGDENFGQVMGERLHLTIREAQWWQFALGKFWPDVQLFWPDDGLRGDRGIFVCMAHPEEGAKENYHGYMA